VIGLSSAENAVVSHVHVWTVGIGVFLNGIGVPGLGELLLPLGGAAVRAGHVNVVELYIVALIAQVLGLTVSYWIGRSGGLILVERYGKYIFLNQRELRATNKAFEKYGSPMVLVGAFVPGPQAFVGYVAGVAQMNFSRFLVSATIGKAIWVGGLMFLGYQLANHLSLIDSSIKQIGLVILIVLVAAGAWYLIRHRQKKATSKKNQVKEG
jgi:membrane protein DedA with SNARE-associated domain